ncbi:TetR/AcrR family transcriptional regulator [Cryptosporangium aurantiacum]|uniref:Transcriptional regulator, TetR family n=1 Tax=Cryptosporangium aurantiacum TaxID=134849 RepID=A0A1M7K178_9ACTN|nr:TetR/AcrR family transcriptional regulator [Cryptosporangium aurantiacum]SHM58931.1 transcriptional regulator, TetR family [Cryptosporangium aurantiacum]
MSEVVKTNRRTEQARATRRRILTEARELFVRQGYAATTLTEIAAAAGVAVQTLYFHFGNKATVLKEILDVLAVGDDAPVALLDREPSRNALDAPDGPTMLALWVRSGREILGRITPVMTIVREAMGTDPDLAAQWRTNAEQRVIAHRMLTDALAAQDALRPGLTVERATDLVYSLLSPELYALLTVERGWTPDEWEEWATETLRSAILRTR